MKYAKSDIGFWISRGNQICWLVLLIISYYSCEFWFFIKFSNLIEANQCTHVHSFASGFYGCIFMFCLDWILLNLSVERWKN